MSSYKTEGINLKSSSFGEGGKLVTIFTKTQGKVKAIAKGARRTKSKFGGRLEIFVCNHLLIAEGKGLDIISQCETIKSFRKIRESSKIEAGVYFLKLVDGSTEVKQVHPELFDLLFHILSLLDEGLAPELLKRVFEVKFLAIEGFSPVYNEKTPLDVAKVIAKIQTIDFGNLKTVNIRKPLLKKLDSVLQPHIWEHIGQDVSAWWKAGP